MLSALSKLRRKLSTAFPFHSPFRVEEVSQLEIPSGGRVTETSLQEAELEGEQSTCDGLGNRATSASFRFQCGGLSG